jgi:hypothetical protein
MNYKVKIADLAKQLNQELPSFLNPERHKFKNKEIAKLVIDYYRSLFKKLAIINRIGEDDKQKLELSYFVLSDTLRAIYEFTNNVTQTAIGKQPDITASQYQDMLSYILTLQKTLENILQLAPNDINNNNQLWFSYKDQYSQSLQWINANMNTKFSLTDIVASKPMKPAKQIHFADDTRFAPDANKVLMMQPNHIGYNNRYQMHGYTKLNKEHKITLQHTEKENNAPSYVKYLT